MKVIDRFTPSIMDSFENFKCFFEGKKELQRIHNSTSCLPYGERLWQSRWNVKLLAMKAAVKKIWAVYVKKIGDFLAKIGLPILAIYCAVHVKHLQQDEFKLRAVEQLREHLLVPSINAHQIKTSDLYTCKDLPVNQITSPQIKECLFPTSIRPNIQFFEPKGLCRGMSNWFAHLYLELQNVSDDSQAHLIAVAKEFEQGASRQAALLQTIEYPEYLFPLQETPGPVFFPCFTQSRDNIPKELEKLPVGLYAASVYHHRMNLIKTQDSYYIFDPDVGLLKLSKERTANYLLKYSPPNPNMHDQIRLYQLTKPCIV